MSATLVKQRLKETNPIVLVTIGLLIIAVVWLIMRNSDTEYIPKPYGLVQPVELYVGPPGINFYSPEGVVVNGKGEAFILDTYAKQVYVVSANGRFLRRFSGTGTGLAELKTPSGIAIGPDGLIYVSDMAKQAILVFQQDGSYVACIKDQLRDSFVPSGMTFNKQGQLLVYNHAYKNFRLYDRTGKKIKEIGSQSFSLVGDDSPKYIALVGNDQRILMAGPNRAQVEVIAMDGKTMEPIGNGVLQRPGGLAVNEKRGLVYVSDTVKHKVVVFDIDANYIGEFGGYGTNMQEFKNPIGLFTTENRIYITDKSNSRVLVYTY